MRTNSESLIGVRVLGAKEDLSRGVAIGSGVYVDEHTHIEVTRYPAGSDSMYAPIAALTERAMSLFPAASDATWDDRAGPHTHERVEQPQPA